MYLCALTQKYGILYTQEVTERVCPLLFLPLICCISYNILYLAHPHFPWYIQATITFSKNMLLIFSPTYFMGKILV